MPLTASKAVEIEMHFNDLKVKEFCIGAALVEDSIADLIAWEKFPLKNNHGPAKNFVRGFLKIKSAGRDLRFYPKAYALIYENMTSDGDKAFNAQERDNVVALWAYTKSWAPIRCVE